MNYIDKNYIPTDRRPLGFWLRAIEGPLRENMRNAFATFGVTRREWRVLTTLHAAPSTLADIEVALPPRGHRGPVREGHRTLDQVLDGFVARGWASLDRGSYALTAEGERIHDAVLTNVQTVRAQVTAGIPDADYATTMSTLEKIAGNVGFRPRGPKGRRMGQRVHRIA
jgi:hypothetical protein